MTLPLDLTPPASPPAQRVRRRSWRDPRLAVGLLLVGGSVVVGAQVLSSADDTVAVLAASGPLAAGQQLEGSDLTTVRLRFGSEADADRYLPTSAELEGRVLLRAVGAGELVPRAALSASGDGGPSPALAELPLAVDAARAPADLRTGAVVDVWAGPSAGAEDIGNGGENGGEGGSELLLTEVPVLATSAAPASGAGGVRQIVVGVPAEGDTVSRVVARAGSALLVVRRPQ